MSKLAKLIDSNAKLIDSNSNVDLIDFNVEAIKGDGKAKGKKTNEEGIEDKVCLSTLATVAVKKGKLSVGMVCFGPRPSEYEPDDPRANDPAFGPFGVCNTHHTHMIQKLTAWKCHPWCSANHIIVTVVKTGMMIQKPTTWKCHPWYSDNLNFVTGMMTQMMKTRMMNTVSSA
jgi:hypothetical protein